MTSHTSSAHPRVGVGDALGGLAARVALLEAERDELNGELDVQRARQVDIGRSLGRRGYLAGRSAARRGAARETAPERRTRGWARELLA
jgi:hypothetical protein